MLIHHGWSDYIYYVGSSFDCRSICEGGLIAGGIGVREGRQTRFLRQSIPRNIDAHSSIRTEKNSIQIEMTTNAHWFDLRLAHNKGLELWQTMNNAIILYDSMPADCLVKVAERNLDHTEAEILFEKRRT